MGLHARAISIRPTLVCSMSSACMLWPLSYCFCGTPNSGSVCISDSFACWWDSFPPVGMLCPVSVWGISSCLIVSSFLVYGCFLLEFFIFFLTGNGGGVDRGKRGGNGGSWDEWKERKLVWIYYIRKQSIFIFKKKTFK